MSSKGRKAVEQDEFYPTPADAIEPLLVSPLLQLPGGRWIEPCAGTGSIIRTVNRHRSDIEWHVCEINPKFIEPLEAITRRGIDYVDDPGDFVHREWNFPMANVMMFNPPFSLALDFVKVGFERAHWVVMLQRKGWIGTKKRGDFLRRYAPDDFTLPERPSFRPDGKTDSADYCWYVWPPGNRERRVGQFALLDPSNVVNQMALL